jgi:hypothetical protein
MGSKISTSFAVPALALLVVLASLASVGCFRKPGGGANRGGSGSSMAEVMMIKIGWEIIKDLIPAVQDSFDNTTYIDPTWGMQYQSPNYHWDPYTNLQMRGNRLGGVNYWAPNGSLVGFSAYHAASNRYVYFDGFGRRVP